MISMAYWPTNPRMRPEFIMPWILLIYFKGTIPPIVAYRTLSCFSSGFAMVHAESPLYALVSNRWATITGMLCKFGSIMF